MPNWKKVVTSGSNAELNNIDSSGYIDITGASSDPGADGVVRLGESNNALRIYTNYGYTQIGPTNASWAHFYTDRNNFYFNQPIVVDDGVVSSYDEDLILRRDYNDTTYNQITIGDDTYELKLDNTVRHSIDGVGNNTFTGNITSSGNISSSGLVVGSNIRGMNSVQVGGTGITMIPHANDSTTLTTFGTNALSVTSHITASGNISSSGTSTGSFGHVMIGGSNIKTFISSSAAADGFGSGGGGGDGDIEGVTAGTGMTGGGDSGAVTLNVIGGNGITANANDMAITAAQTTITSVTNTSLKVGRGTSDTYIDFGTDDKIKLKPANATALEVETGGVDVTGAITSSGNISASGDVYGDRFYASDRLAIDYTSAGDAIKFGNLTNKTTIRGAAAAGGTLVGTNVAQPVTIGGHLTASYNISASSTTGTHTFGGQTTVNQITASGFQLNGSGTAELEVEGHITASGNISASGIVTAEGLVISDDATITDDLTVSGQIELGHASDTTLTRASSGNVNIEGNLVYRAGGTDVPVADGGTGASSLTDGGVLLGSGTSAITAMSVLSDGEMIVGDGSGDPVAESGATLRTSIGVGAANNVIFNHITASGQISSSGTTTSNHFSASGNIHLNAASPNDGHIYFTDVNTRITGTTTGITISPHTAGTTFDGNITASGNISASGNILAPIKAQKNTPTINYGTGAELTPNANDYSGEVIYDGNDSTDAGKIYYSNNGTWTATDADAAATSTGLIAVALGSNSTTHGMLLRGMVKLDHDPGGNIGVALYLSVTAGQASNSAPTGNNDIARVIGYNLGTSGEIYFNPDNTWVEVNA